MKNLLIAFEMGMSCRAPWNEELREVATSIANLFDSYIEVVGVTRPLPTSLLVGEMDTYSAEALRPCTEGDAYAAFEKSFGLPQSPRAFTWNGLVEMDLLDRTRAFSISSLWRDPAVFWMSHHETWSRTPNSTAGVRCCSSPSAQVGPTELLLFHGQTPLKRRAQLLLRCPCCAAPRACIWFRSRRSTSLPLRPSVPCRHCCATASKRNVRSCRSACRWAEQFLSLPKRSTPIF